MPELYKKFRDSQGLASVSRALHASKGSTKLEGDKLPDIQRKTELEGQEGPGQGLKGGDEQSQRPDKVDNEQKKKKKQRRSAGGEHDDIDQTSETLAPQKRKKTTKKALSQSVDETRFASEGAEDDGTLPSPSLEPGKGNAESGTAHAKGEGSQEQQTFRDFYVKTFSSAFASELFDLRQAEGESMSLGLLLRQIESGINIFSDLEKDLLQGRAASS
ncbi:hypothetical protein CVIRNUC_005313 [Coccomyxa viridis]|uniref:Ribosome assembly protein 3 n=1 Tax=Coccomyxa viridis TaxID=1274662 RepID=A0AAV1I7V2_9CHLO|nr:hypothetical protein CVIRNUC_005313 [Coccomyxa viridis]